jgi:hypothetical protein
MVGAAGDPDAAKLQGELEELRALVRELSARLASLVSVLPLDAALALARGEDAAAEGPFRLADWRESIELTRADVESEMKLLWKRLPPRESA